MSDYLEGLFKRMQERNDFWNDYVEEMVTGPKTETIDAGTYRPGIAITTLGCPHSSDAFKKRTCRG